MTPLSLIKSNAGKIGGRARALKLSKERRIEIARMGGLTKKIPVDVKEHDRKYKLK